jgi:hypothetical protein
VDPAEPGVVELDRCGSTLDPEIEHAGPRVEGVLQIPRTLVTVRPLDELLEPLLGPARRCAAGYRLEAEGVVVEKARQVNSERNGFG